MKEEWPSDLISSVVIGLLRDSILINDNGKLMIKVRKKTCDGSVSKSLHFSSLLLKRGY